jgi:hypothetical protein
MVLSYVRVRCPPEEAMARYGRWIGAPEVRPLRLVPEREIFDLATLDEEWLGLAVFIYASGPWTVIEEVSGGLAARSPESWLDLAQGGDLVFASYNDTIAYAMLVVVIGGRLVRQFLQDEQEPDEDVNEGRLPEESRQRFENWTDVARWVEEDESELTRPEEGWLWIHQALEWDDQSQDLRHNDDG